VAIGSLGVGDHVLAYDEASGTTASYPISVVHINADPETGTVVVGGETIETTPGHPFYTLEAGWLDAADLEPGMHVPSASGEPGEVSSVDFAARPAIMYNLTVEIAHTFFVGEGEWLVHNCGPSYDDLRKSGARDAHHIIQDAAVRDLPGYSRGRAPAIRLEGPATRPGTPHYLATQSQKAAGGGTYAGERRIGYRALRTAGVSRPATRAAIHRADSYFRGIGVTASTATRIPATRRLGGSAL
jgi:hypothetical protein